MSYDLSKPLVIGISSRDLFKECGWRKKLKLKEHTYECVCGLVLNRDINAAINIKREGLRLFEEMMK